MKTSNDTAIPGASIKFTSMDYVFQWPIYQGGPADLYAPDQLLVADQAAQYEKVKEPRKKLPSLDDDELCGLIDTYVQLIHVRQPVLDERTLSRWARSVAELGPQWDAKSCLVVGLPRNESLLHREDQG